MLTFDIVFVGGGGDTKNAKEMRGTIRVQKSRSLNNRRLAPEVAEAHLEMDTLDAASCC